MAQEIFVADASVPKVVEAIVESITWNESPPSESGVLVEKCLGLVVRGDDDIKVPAEVSPNVVLLVTPIAADVAKESGTSVVEDFAIAPNTEIVDPAMNDPVPVETTTEKPKKEYIVLVLEGKPKTEKRQVLGVGTMTGRIISAPDENAPILEARNIKNIT